MVARLNCGLGFYEHVFGYKSNVHLQNAFRKYGLYVFIVLEYFEIKDTRKTMRTVYYLLEQKYLDLLNPEYNISKTAKVELGAPRSEDTKELIRSLKTGTKHSDATRPC